MRTSVRIVNGLTPSKKGAIAEAEVAAAATRAGIVVLRPDTGGGRYDLVFDTGPELLRVQCKYANQKGDVIVVYTGTCRLTPSGYRRTTYTRDEVDLVAVFCPDVDECFFIPIHDVEGRHVLHLRLAAARNNQKMGVTMADEYRLGAVAQLGERCHGMAEVRGSSPLSSTDPKAA
jgi:PD-(D/E)XK nuclease superfamily protein